MEERAAREDETGAGAVTGVDVTGDAQSLAPGKLASKLRSSSKSTEEYNQIRLSTIFYLFMSNFTA